MKIQRLFLLLITLSPLANAGFFLKPMATYRSNSSEGYKSSTSIFDIGAGFITEKGWIIGGTYVTENHSTAYGPSVGWTSLKDVGPFVMAHYFVPKSDAGSSTKISGYKGDLGVKIAMRRLSLAVQLSYRRYESKSDSFSVPSTYIDPLIGLFITF